MHTQQRDDRQSTFRQSTPSVPFMDSSQLDSRAAWVRLTISLVIAIIGNIGMWAIIVVMPSVQAEFGIGRADASLPYTVTMIAFAIGNVVIGKAIDRWGIVVALVAAALLEGAGFLLAAYATSLNLLLIAQAFIGFASAACFGPLIADISHWFMKRRGIAVAIVASGNYLSGAIWPLVLSGVLATSGWRTAYLILAMSMIFAMLPLSLFLRRKISEGATLTAEIAASEAAKNVAFSPKNLQIILCLAGVACCVAMSMPQVHIVALSVDLGYGPTVGAEMLSLMLAGGVVSRLISGVLADRVGGIVTLFTGSVLQCIALFLYLPTDGLTSLYLVSLIFGLSQGGIVPSYAVIVREYMPAREAGSRVGIVIMATILGMALGGWMSGWIYDLTGSYQLAFLNGIAWNMLNIALIALIFLRGRTRKLQLA